MHTKLSQVQAARAAGVSRPTIYRAIKSGKLSAERADDGSVRIDLSELQRLFPEADPDRVHGHAHDGTESDHEQLGAGDQAAQLRTLSTLVDDLKGDKRNQQEQIEHLHQELARAREERSQLLSMLRQKDQTIAHKDALLEEQMQTVKLLTDQTTRPRKWWARFWS